MNYYKIKNGLLNKDGIDTFAHLTDGDNTIVSDVDVRRVVGFNLTPEDVQARYGVRPLSQDELLNIKRNANWWMKKSHG